MSFLHLSLLAGGILIAVPILLHLLMRRRPKHELFPALRFVKQLHQTNQQKLRFKNWLLLLLRCAIVLGLAFALARPTVASEQLAGWTLIGGLGFLAGIAGLAAITGIQSGRNRWLATGLGVVALILGGLAITTFVNVQSDGSGSLLTEREAPVAAALVFDISPRMGLTFENQSLLDKAKELGDWLLTQLPEDSEVAVVDNGTGTAVFSIDEMAAQKSIQAMTQNTITQPIVEPIKAALELLKSSAKSTKEIYVMTDLTQMSWNRAPDTNLAKQVEDVGIRVYILDVGVEKPENVTVGVPQLSGELIARGTQLSIECELRNQGRRREVTAELVIEKPDPRLPMIVDGRARLPELQLRHEQTVELDDGGSASVEFAVPPLSVGSHHGQIRLRGEDGLTIDNRRHFTVQATDQWPVLISSGAGAISDYLLDTLAPVVEEQSGQASYKCDLVTINDLRVAKLTDYSAVALLDPPPLPDGVWKRLSQFVDRGGGLAIFLGRNAESAAAFNSAAALELMPSRIVRQSRASGVGLSMRLSSAPHPMLTWLRPEADSIVWSDYAIRRHWSLDRLAEKDVVVRFGNGNPAIVERQVGLGRVIVWTTPISDPTGDSKRPAWNRLPTGIDPFPFFALTWESFQYIVQQGETQLNYEVGQPVSLAVREATGNGRYQLFVPSGSWQEVTASKNRVTLQFANTPGTYRLRPASGRGRHWGFSMNLPKNTTNLDRIETSALNEWFGEDGFRLARDREAVNREVGEARVGRELYPWVLVFVSLVLILEYLLANRFYHRRSSAALEVSREANVA